MKPLRFKYFLSATLLLLSLGIATSAFANEACKDLFVTAALGSRDNPIEMLPPGEKNVSAAGVAYRYRTNKFSGERIAVDINGRDIVSPSAPAQAAKKTTSEPVSQAPLKTSQVAAPKKESWLSKVTRSFFKKDTQKEDVIFVGKPLSDIQFNALKKSAKKGGRPIVAGDKIIIATQDMFERQHETLVGIGVVEIQKSGHFENALIKASNIDADPREALSIRIHTRDQIIETGILAIGEESRVNPMEAYAQLARFLDHNQIEGITQIEVAHTHPQYAVWVKDEAGNFSASIHELNQGDVNAGVQFRSTLPPHIGVIIKAIVPNGFSYVGYIR